MQIYYFLLLSCFLFFHACAGGPTTNNNKDNKLDGVSESIDGKDLQEAEKITPDGEEADRDICWNCYDEEEFEEENIIDSYDGDLPPEEICPIAGNPWCPCEEDKDCISNYCIETWDGKVCTTFCTPESPCPYGWQCIPTGELIYICVYTHPKLCTPCKEDYQCQNQFSKLDNHCYSFGDTGSFCTGECSEKIGCPSEFECKEVEIGEEKVNQCMPKDGICKCNDKLVKEGDKSKTNCFKTNDAGKCQGETYCTKDGLLPCTAKEPEKEICDGVDNNCDGQTDEGLQESDCFVENTYGKCPGKLYCVSGVPKCQGKEPAPEVCDGLDNNCNEIIDEEGALGCTTYYKDDDGDMWGLEDEWICSCKPVKEYPTKKYGDCNDNDKTIHPQADEYCDKIDNDCDDETDEIGAKGCMKYYKDLDSDGYGIESDNYCYCKPIGPYNSLLQGDCDDKNENINPAAEEKCDGIDNNCIKGIDEEGAKGCVEYYFDYDGDGFGVTENVKCLCKMEPPYKAIVGGDCEDKDFGVKPTATETCNLKDDDCNGIIDDEKALGCKEFCLDDDEDGYGLKDKNKCLCKGVNKYTDDKCQDDCNDEDKEINPYAIEVCDLKDNDCDGLTDQNYSGTDVVGCKNYYYDSDSDGYGSKMYKCLCGPQGYFSALTPDDCNDGNKYVNPGAKEVCGNQLDENCNDLINEDGAIGCSKYWVDVDGDGYGDMNTFKCLCYAEEPYIVKNGNDCNDNNKYINPTQPEKCGDGVDNNCDGGQNDPGAQGCKWYYLDEDKDGWGVEGNDMCLCYGESPYTAIKVGDCKDDNPDINDGMPEKCNGFDDNCDNKIDGFDSIDCTTWFYDNDQDGYGTTDVNTKCTCKSEGKWTAIEPGDCVDNDPAVNPGQQEICNNAKNDDCDADVDEEGALGCEMYYKDLDGDTFGDNNNPKCLCEMKYPYITYKGEDCDDSDNNIKPNADEKCNGKDDNCDTIIDPENSLNCANWYFDGDLDTYGDENNFKCLCAAFEKYSTKKIPDCNDNDVEINPVATEKCNEHDDDCDGFTDEENATNCKVYYYDVDDDGYGLTSLSRCLCKPEGLYKAENKGDCNDNDHSVNPGVGEKCNFKDDDCDANTDEEGAEGCLIWCKDADEDGWGEEGSKKCLCQPDTIWNTTICGDCDDTSYYIFPGGTETCDSKDNDCDGLTDEEWATGCKWYYIDKDNDLYGLPNPTKCLCTAYGEWTGLYLTDCDDDNKNTYPGAPEKCDDKDNDCDAFTDEIPVIDCINFYFDGDKDGYGVGPTFQCMCKPSEPFTSPTADDCNDLNPNIHPGQTEVCNDVDDDCDSVIDNPGSQNCKIYCYDNDNDGFGNESDKKCLCKAYGNYTTTTCGDCDDSNYNKNPNQVEKCDNIDNNCSGVNDDGDPYQMCGAVINGIPSCQGGKCVAKCNSGWYDLDEIYQTGCECGQDSFDTDGVGNSPESAVDMGELQDTGADTSKSGKIVPEDDVDWFKVKALDNPDTNCDKFNFKVKFLSPAPNDTFGFVIYRGSVSSGNQMCSDKPQLTDFQWNVTQAGNPPANNNNFCCANGCPTTQTCWAGQCPCSNNSDGKNHCNDGPQQDDGDGPLEDGVNNPDIPATTDYYIKVFKIKSGKTCVSYTITVSNG